MSTRVLLTTALLLSVTAPATLSQQTQPGRYDLLIRSARVYDGNGNPWIRADVGITGDRIQAVGVLEGATATKTIDAADMAVAPGFIDVHSHAGGGLASETLKHGQPVLAQGITTVLVNPDGGGPTDLAAQRVRYAKQGIGLNVGLMVPHGSIRSAVMGMTDRDPDSEQLAKMVDMVRQGMRAGALGLSSGLYYAPGSYSKTAEVRVSLTPRPGGDRCDEVYAACELLQALGLRTFAPSVTACPGCGRTTSTTFQELAERVQDYIRDSMPRWKEQYEGVEELTLAVMGCVVNGPGESKAANIGISLPGTGEAPNCPVYIDGEHVTTLRGTYDELAAAFQKLVDNYVDKKYQRHPRKGGNAQQQPPGERGAAAPVE